jgi:tape measure domain-containing protein
MANMAELSLRLKATGAQAVEASLKAIKSELQQTTNAANNAEQGLQNFGRSLASGSALLAGFTAAAGVAVGSFLALRSAFSAAVETDNIVRGLATVTGSSAELRSELDALREAAKLPGLGFEEAARGAVALQSVGLSADLSIRALKGFGNALASVGKGKAELDGVITALSQIVSKGQLQAEEINQIAERVPQIRKLLVTAFGTGDTQQIQGLGLTAEDAVKRLVAATETLPLASSGIGNSLENLSDAFRNVQVLIGTGIVRAFESAAGGGDKLVSTLTQIAEQLGQVFQAVGESGALKVAFDGIANALGVIAGGDYFATFARFASYAIAFLGNLPTLINNVAVYFRGLWLTVAGNAQIAFQAITSFIPRYLELIRQQFSATFKSIAEDIKFQVGSAFRAITGSSFGIGNFKDYFNSVKQLDNLKKQQTALTADPFNTKGFFPLAPISSITGNLPFSANAIYNAIASVRRPVDIVPQGLNFGGTSGGSIASQTPQSSRFLDLLNSIEKNTAKTAEAASLRAQATGGGPLARIGVSPAELSAGGGFRNPAVFTRDSARPVSTALQGVVERMINDSLTKRLGSGFNPR